MTIKPFPPPEKFTIGELERRLKILKEEKKIPIIGKNRYSAVGESLERYLGLAKNTSKSADWGEYELKTLKETRSKLRLFSLNWNYSEDYSVRQLVLDYGKDHFSKHLQKQVKRLDWKIPFSKIPLSQLHYTIAYDNELNLRYNEKILGKYKLNILEEHFNQKIKNLVLIEFVTTKNKQNLTFSINRVSLFEEASFKSFIFSIKNNIISLAFALMLIEPNSENEKLNNRGATIEIYYQDLKLIYNKISSIC